MPDPMLICEGYEGAFFPELAYVQQGEKVCFLRGEAALCESVADKVVVESIDQLNTIEEKAPDGTIQKRVVDGKWIVEGPAQRSDVKNKNGRIYGRGIWERLIANEKSAPMQTLRERGMVGHLEHPKDGRTDGNEVALVMTDLRLQEDGVVWGKAEILDTPKGQILQEYTRKNVRWGWSSRGTGSVDDKGMVNEEDYMVETWDAVMRPSVPGAYVKPANLKEKDKKTESEETNLSEEAAAEVARIKSVLPESMEELDESGLIDARNKLVSAMQDVTGLVKSERLSALQATDLQDWLSGQLRNIFQRESEVVESRITQALSNLGGDDRESDEAFTRVVESLQGRIGAVCEENEQLREQHEQAVARIKALEDEKARMQNAYELLHDQHESLTKRLDLAESVIADQTVAEVDRGVYRAVEQAIHQVPGLEAFRTELEEATTVEEVETIAEGLLPAVLANRPESKRPAVVRRSSLPPVGMIVESESVAPPSRKTSNPSVGARAAGRVLKAMQPNS